jgi:hypothetical protein
MVLLNKGKLDVPRGTDRIRCGKLQGNTFSECREDAPFKRIPKALLPKQKKLLGYAVDSLGAPANALSNYADLEANRDPFGNLHQMSDVVEVAQIIGIALACVALTTLLIGVVVWAVRRKSRSNQEDPVAIP